MKLEDFKEGVIYKWKNGSDIYIFDFCCIEEGFLSYFNYYDILICYNTMLLLPHKDIDGIEIYHNDCVSYSDKIKLANKEEIEIFNNYKK